MKNKSVWSLPTSRMYAEHRGPGDGKMGGARQHIALIAAESAKIWHRCKASSFMKRGCCGCACVSDAERCNKRRSVGEEDEKDTPLWTDSGPPHLLFQP